MLPLLVLPQMNMFSIPMPLSTSSLWMVSWDAQPLQVDDVWNGYSIGVSNVTTFPVTDTTSTFCIAHRDELLTNHVSDPSRPVFPRRTLCCR